MSSTRGVIVTRRMAERLAAALASRLAGALPPGVHASHDDGTLWLHDDARSSGTPLADLLTLGPSAVPDGFPGINPLDLSPDAHVDEEISEEELDLEEFREHVVLTVSHALSRVQDFVSEALSSPWPPDAGRTGRTLPEVDVTWEGSSLTIRFGDPSDPVLSLPSILATEFVPAVA
jgi:hypothetical protein